MNKVLSPILLVMCMFLRSFNPISRKKPTTVSKSFNLIIYSGNCKYYRRDYVHPRKVRWVPISQKFAKIVIDKRAKKFSFFYDGKLVFTQSNYYTSIENEQGGEGFTFSGNIDGTYSAIRMIAEHNFVIVYTNHDTYKPELLGYQYELENYKIN